MRVPSNIKIYRVGDYEQMSAKAARIIQAQLLLKPRSVLGLATGSSPVGLYKCLAEWQRAGDVDFSSASSVNLDEYCGLAGDNPQSYRYFMNTHLFDKVNIDRAKTFVPNGLDADAEKECARYDRLIDELGGIDLQLLGIGNNGHIGFNEPAENFTSGTHKEPLTQSTITANRRFFENENDVPRFAYTLGIGAIMRARRILLIASGKAKAGAIKSAVTGKITPQLPASVLQLHRDVIIVADHDALSQI